MKTVHKILFLSFIMITHFSYSMDKIHKTEEEMFQENLSKLSEPLARFVNDFKTWPKCDQDKVKLRSNSGGVSASVRGKPVSANKFDENITYWLNKQLTNDQTIPFFLAIDYLKKKK